MLKDTNAPGGAGVVAGVGAHPSLYGSHSLFGSVLFLTIDGSGSRQQGEKYAHAVEDLRRQCAEIVPRCNGSVNRLQGTGMLATFGYPFFYGNEAYNATHAALQLNEVLQQFRQKHPALEFGLGVVSGEFSVSRADRSASGQPVEDARELANRIDGCVIDGETFRWINDIVTVEEFEKGELSLKTEVSIHSPVSLDHDAAHRKYVESKQIDPSNMPPKD